MLCVFGVSRDKTSFGETMHCLIVDQDSTASRAMFDGLLTAGYKPGAAFTGEDGLAQALARQWDVIVVDAALPGALSTLELIRAIRSVGHLTPIIVISNLGCPEHIVRALRSGADDYVAKPVMMIELIARMEALWRRTASGMYALQLRVDDLMLDVGTMRVTRGTRQIALQLREFRLLEYLMRNEGQLVTRETLLKSVWNYQFDPNTNIVDVQISRLRSKMDKPFPMSLIHTVRCAGYVLSAQQPRALAGAK
ncbi:MAG: response regulator [Massilia sp.]|nr:response regulator [Massilia sp.]